MKAWVVACCCWLVLGVPSVGLASASGTVQHVVQWILSTADHQGLPFVVVDKTQAQVFVFNASGLLLGAAPALLGLAWGDDSPPGLGERALADIAPHERITPSGRFMAELDRNAAGQELLWVDYEQAISLHPVRSTNPSERRLERLASATARDNRISYGCINVPIAFWRDVVRPTFKGTSGVVYVLPDTLSLGFVFAMDSHRAGD